MLDEIDKRILMILMENSRTSLIDIAERLKEFGIEATATTVKRRMDAMVKKGIIKKYTVQLDVKKVNYDYLSLLEIKVEPSMLSEAIKNLSSMHEITELYVIENESNIFAKVRCRTSDELVRFIERLSRIPYIKGLKSRLVLRAIKEDTYIPLINEARIKTFDFNEDGVDEVVMENNKLLLSIAPNSGGRINSLIYKETGTNEVYESLGMLYDTFLEEGWGVYLANERYDYEILRGYGKRVKVMFSKVLEGENVGRIKLEKVISMDSINSEFDVKYIVTNLNRTTQKVSLWVCNYLNIGGDVSTDDWLYLPVENGTYVERFEPNYSGITWPTYYLKELPEERYKEVYKRRHTQLSDERVTNGWAAYYNNTTKEILGILWSLDDVSLVKRYFSPSYYSIELVFNTVTLRPRESREFQLTVFVGRGDWTDVYSRWVDKYSR